MTTSTALSSEFGSSPPKLRSMDEEEVLPHPLRMHPVPADFKPPVIKNFTFSVSGLWQSNGNLLRWITEVPSVHHDMSFTPTESQCEKHGLNPNDMFDGHDGGQHRDKKAKIWPAAGYQGTAAVRRRSRIVQSTCDAARRLSTSFQSIFSSSRSQAELGGSTVERMRSPLGSLPSYKPRERLRFAVVGDSACGKTCMLLRWYFNTHTDDWTRTQYELFNKSIDVDGRGADLEVWDTSGRIELKQLELLSYLTWDGIFLCFSVNSDKKFRNAQTRWIHEIHRNCRGAPIFLIGTKKDLRIGSGIWSPLFPNFETRIGTNEGAIAARGIGAVGYMECSSKTGEGVDKVFEDAVRMARTIRYGKHYMARDKSRGSSLGQLLCF